MGIFERLERPRPRADVTWTPLDDRWYQSVATFASTFTGFPISPDTALRVSTVFACNSLIAETVASLPCVLYRRLPDGGKEKATDHRLYRTLRSRPNRWMTAMDYFGAGQMQLGLRGNAYSEIRDDGLTVELLPLHPDRMRVEELASGRLRYTVLDPKGAAPRPLSQDQVLHVRDLSQDGITGQARAVLAREAIAVAAAGEAFVGGFFKNDATGRLLITHPAQLSEEKRAEFRKMIEENYAGWANRAKTMLLSSGVTATELGKHDDSGFIIDPRKFQVADIARFWRVPLFMIGLEEKSTSWGTGIEQQKQGFVDFTIKPWSDRWAQSLARALLTEEEQDEYVVEFLFADLVRGDLLSRFQAYQIARTIGVLNPNEIRARENEGPREGGEEYQVTPTGAAPNPAPAAPPPQAAPPTAAQLPTVPARTEEEAPTIAIPAPLLADAVQRIVGAETRELEKRAPKAAADPAKWAAWLRQYCAEHRDYVAKVLAPFQAAYGVEAWVLAAVGARIEQTAVTALRIGVPAGWLERRAEEVALILDETLRAGAAVQRTSRDERLVLALDRHAIALARAAQPVARDITLVKDEQGLTVGLRIAPVAAE